MNKEEDDERATFLTLIKRGIRVIKIGQGGIRVILEHLSYFYCLASVVGHLWKNPKKQRLKPDYITQKIEQN